MDSENIKDLAEYAGISVSDYLRLSPDSKLFLSLGLRRVKLERRYMLFGFRVLKSMCLIFLVLGVILGLLNYWK